MFEKKKDSCPGPEEYLPYVCDQKYGGNWELFLKDLEEKLKKQPKTYFFVEKVRRDMEWILNRLENDDN